jgi:Skp family chaperone for outer membrane proteins
MACHRSCGDMRIERLVEGVGTPVLGLINCIALADGIKNDLTPTMLKIEQDKIMGLEQRYQQTQTLLQQQLQTLANEYNQPILDRLQKAVEIVADRKKVNYVMDVSKLLYSKMGIDITAEVKMELAKLDAESMKR